MVGDVQDGAPERVVLRCRRWEVVQWEVHWHRVGRFASFERGKDSSSVLGSRFSEGTSPRLFPVAGRSQFMSRPNVLDLTVASIVSCSRRPRARREVTTVRDRICAPYSELWDDIW